MGEDVGVLEGSQTKSGVPIEHLDYRYIGQCKNGKELEKILKVLSSGEEGIYPDLIEFTEKRLEEVSPKSKSLRKEMPIKTYQDLSASEEQEITNDLEEWMANVNKADESLKKEGVTRDLTSDKLPPIRSAAGSNEVLLSKEQENSSQVIKNKTGLPRSFHEWDRFDPEKEIECLEKRDEEERKKKQEQAKGMNKNTVPPSLELKDKSETERRVLANREKEKGNEAFQSGNYSEALMYYCRSIELNPQVTAVYNNRALAEIKLEKFKEAVDDCDRVLIAEPKNVKAYLRRSLAHQGQGLKERATEDLYKALSIDPSNKRAKELLGEMKKDESVDTGQPNPTKSQEPKKAKHDSGEIDGTSYENHQDHTYAVTGKTATTTKGKRLKIVEVESENDSERNANETSASCVDEINELPTAEHIVLDNRTEESEDFGSVEESKSVENPDLPGLVVKAQKEGTQLFKLGQFAEAAERFTQAIDILQKDKLSYQSAICSLLCNRGSCLLRIGDCAGCIADCTSALKIFPRDFRSVLKRAKAYERSEKYTKAWHDYQFALRIQSHHQGALQGNTSVSKHLESLYGRNWKEKVIQATASQDATVHGVLTDDPADSPRDTSPHPTHASSTINSTVTVQPSPRGDTSDPHTPSLKETPTDDSRSTAGNDSVDPAARFAQCKEQGNSWVKQNRYQDAVSCYTDCLCIDPVNVAVYTNRALCFLRLGQNQLAINDTTEALRLQPNNVKALFRRAQAKKALSQYDSAARDLFELQKIEPKNTAAKKELDVVLDLCRKERRESAEKTTKSKLKEEKSEAKPEQEKSKNNQEIEAPKWKRINIEDIQHDDEDDPQPPQKEKISANSEHQPKQTLVHKTESNTTNKPIKLAKKTAYDFFQAWSAVRKGNTKGHVDLLRQLETTQLAKVLSNKLDASMLNNIIAALKQELVPQGEEKLACTILEQLTKVERFDMVLLFLSAEEKNELQELFSNLQARVSNQGFVTSEELKLLRKKYKM